MLLPWPVCSRGRAVASPQRHDEEHHCHRGQQSGGPALRNGELPLFDLLRAHRRKRLGDRHGAVVPIAAGSSGGSEVAYLRPDLIPVGELVPTNPDQRAVFLVVHVIR